MKLRDLLCGTFITKM